MNKRLKNALKASFDVPQPPDKDRFIKMLRYPKINYRKFLPSQFRYIRKRVWAFSIVMVFIGWVVALWSPDFIDLHMEAKKIWSVSAILPFLAMLTVTELYRSSFHRMAELEMTCRFSLHQVIMARITILGGGNFMILTLLLVFMSRVSAYSMLQVITYLMVPYFITCGVCLLILNHMRGRESMYCCAAAACLACVTNIIFSSTVQQLYSNSYIEYWLILFAFSAALIGLQLRNLIKKAEDRTWNLLLIE